MNQLKIKDFIRLKIDSIQDEIDFNVLLFSEGKYGVGQNTVH